jgi:hypothetical protein
VRGPRDFSRGIRTQFSRTEGSKAPGSGVAVSSSGSLWCPENFEDRPTFLFVGYPPRKKAVFGVALGAPRKVSGWVRQSWTGRRFRGLPRQLPQGAAVKGGVYMNQDPNPGKFFQAFPVDFTHLSTICPALFGFHLGDPRVPAYFASFTTGSAPGLAGGPVPRLSSDRDLLVPKSGEVVQGRAFALAVRLRDERQGRPTR